MNTQTEAREKNSVKTYICGLCGNEEQHYTNHFGEIYTPCKKCGNGQLYCKGYEPINGLTTKLTVYRFNLENQSEKHKYSKLKEKLNATGAKLFDCISQIKHGYFDNLRKHETVEIETRFIFDNQWNTNLGRLHDWYEEIYPDKKIKEGYYLTLTEDHKKLRKPRPYLTKTYYNEKLIGEDIFYGINTSDPSNAAFNKYTPTIENFDIWKYRNSIELINQ